MKEFDLYARSMVPLPEGDYIPPKPYIRPGAGKLVTHHWSWGDKKKYVHDQLESGRKFAVSEIVTELSSRPKTVYDLLSDLKRRGYPVAVERRRCKVNRYYKSVHSDTIQSTVDAIIDRIVPLLRSELVLLIQGNLKK